ncbi:uncharacterized protein LOC135310009 [Plodia interpunctella]|uniref:uncharacterized protein LOC135310009 n=1 Tax=Plodia interpunctella TaxID=58824 RepID=UPI00310122CD
MWLLLILLSISLSVNCHVLPDEPLPETHEASEASILQYVKHFRQILSDYITTQYKTNAQDYDKVSTIIDAFFRKLASDLFDVLNNNGKEWEPKTNVEDGLPDEKFDEVKRNIRHQYSEITDSSANEIVYRLRVNLYDTKLKLDDIMKKDKIVESEESSEEYDS